VDRFWRGNFSSFFDNFTFQLLIGSDELTLGQYKIQMAAWCIWSAPLIMSVDLRFITEDVSRLLQNKIAIEIDQDERGEMGRMMLEESGLHFFVKKIEPCNEDAKMYSYALAIVNRSNRSVVSLCSHFLKILFRPLISNCSTSALMAH
jgi:hypothetical protein